MQYFLKSQNCISYNFPKFKKTGSLKRFFFLSFFSMFQNLNEQFYQICSTLGEISNISPPRPLILPTLCLKMRILWGVLKKWVASRSVFVSFFYIPNVVLYVLCTPPLETWQKKVQENSFTWRDLFLLSDTIKPFLKL